MSSTKFTGTVTRIPAEWANDVDQLVYAVFGAVRSLDEVKTLLGLGALVNGGPLRVEGGAVEDTPIGVVRPAVGRFTSLRVTGALDTDDRSVVVRSQLQQAITSVLESVNTSAVAITGGSIDGVRIGMSGAAAAAFTEITVPVIHGGSANILLNEAGYALRVNGTSDTNRDIGLILRPGAAVRVTEGVNRLAWSEGRLVLNGTDDGNSILQANGTVRATRYVTDTAMPTAENELVPKSYVDSKYSTILTQARVSIGNALLDLGDMADQWSDEVSITGGAIDGVTIGATVAAQGTFTQVNSNVLNGSNGWVNTAGTGGYNNSGLVLGASRITRPSISLVPAAKGVVAVVAGGQAVFRVHADGGRTIVGLGGDDGANTFQVHGPSLLNGRTTLAGGTMTGAVTPSLGSGAPTLAEEKPLWVRIRVKTPGGVRECVIPAFIVA